MSQYVLNIKQLRYPMSNTNNQASANPDEFSFLDRRSNQIHISYATLNDYFKCFNVYSCDNFIETVLLFYFIELR